MRGLVSSLRLARSLALPLALNSFSGGQALARLARLPRLELGRWCTTSCEWNDCDSQGDADEEHGDTDDDDDDDDDDDEGESWTGENARAASGCRSGSALSTGERSTRVASPTDSLANSLANRLAGQRAYQRRASDWPARRADRRRRRERGVGGGERASEGEGRASGRADDWRAVYQPRVILILNGLARAAPLPADDHLAGRCQAGSAPAFVTRLGRTSESVARFLLAARPGLIIETGPGRLERRGQCLLLCASRPRAHCERVACEPAARLALARIESEDIGRAGPLYSSPTGGRAESRQRRAGERESERAGGRAGGWAQGPFIYRRPSRTKTSTIDERWTRAVGRRRAT